MILESGTILISFLIREIGEWKQDMEEIKLIEILDKQIDRLYKTLKKINIKTDLGIVLFLGMLSQVFMKI